MKVDRGHYSAMQGKIAMTDLILVILGLLSISSLCSLLESVLFSLSRPYIQVLLDREKRSGRILKKMKDEIDEPVAAILTLNTVSHTIGAAISGALAINLFGSRWMGLFSALLTMMILVFSEIIPKTIGARYWKNLSPVSAYMLRGMIIVLKPLIVPMNLISRLFSRGDPGERVSKAEVYNLVRIGYRQGVLDDAEFAIMENLFNLRDFTVEQIMTPRTVVVYLYPDSPLKELQNSAARLGFSRIPLYDSLTNQVTGIVLRRDIMNSIADKKLGRSVKALAVKPRFVPETMSVLKLLTLLVKDQVHMAVVLNEFGDYVGIVTMEDALESLLGVEIVDEFDPVVDMRKLARDKITARQKGEKQKK